MDARGTPVLLSDKQLAIIEALERIAKWYETTPAAIALAWVMNKPGVSSTIIGVRNVTQLQANLSAADIQLQATDIASLDALSAPPATFVTEYKELVSVMQHGGIEINGIKPPRCRNHSRHSAGKILKIKVILRG